MCMGGPSIPAAAPLPPPTPPPPTAVDPAVLAARQNATAAAMNAAGRGSTIAPQMVNPLDSSNSQKKALLGQ